MRVFSRSSMKLEFFGLELFSEIGGASLWLGDVWSPGARA